AMLAFQPISAICFLFSSGILKLMNAPIRSMSTGSALITRPVQTIHFGVVVVCGMDMGWVLSNWISEVAEFARIRRATSNFRILANSATALLFLLSLRGAFHAGQA